MAAAVTLPEIDNARPSDDDGAAREEREVRASALGGKERERSYYGSEDKRTNIMGPTVKPFGPNLN